MAMHVGSISEARFLKYRCYRVLTGFITQEKIVDCVVKCISEILS